MCFLDFANNLQIIGEDDNDSLIVVEGNDSLILMDNQANVGHQSQTSALDRVQERVNERYRHEAEKVTLTFNINAFVSKTFLGNKKKTGFSP